MSQNLIDLFFEALLEHLISLIKNDGLESRKIDISSFDVIKDSTTSANKEVDTTAERSRLVVDIDATVDSQRIEFVLTVLQFSKLILNL